MKHKTWFRLVLKAIGVLLISLSFHSIIPAVAAAVTYLLQRVDPSLPSNDYAWWNWSYYAAGFVQLIFGFYLFFGGKWIVNKAIPSNRAYCPECGYQIANAESASCPECGVVLPRSGANESSGI